MGLFTWLFRGAEVVAPPENKMEAQPITVNAPQDVKAARHAGRLSRLYAVREITPEITQEIKQRQAALTAAGHDVPSNAQEAAAMAQRLGG